MSYLPEAFLSGVLVGWLAGRSITKRMNTVVFAALVKHGVITWHDEKYAEAIKKLRGE